MLCYIITLYQVPFSKFSVKQHKNSKNQEGIMLRRALFIASLCLSCNAAIAQKHVHGEGQLLIAQQLHEWQFQFILPVADLLGFEHIPESAEQKQKLINVVSQIEDADEMITLPKFCKLLSMSHSLLDFGVGSAASSQSHSDVHKQQTPAEVKHAHTDVSITYNFNCKNNPDSAIARLLEWSTSVHILNTQWVTNEQQGAVQLKPSSNIVRFEPL